MNEHSQDRVEESKVAWKVLICRKKQVQCMRISKKSVIQIVIEICRKGTLNLNPETESKQIEVFDGICIKCHQPVPRFRIRVTENEGSIKRQKVRIRKVDTRRFHFPVVVVSKIR